VRDAAGGDDATGAGRRRVARVRGYQGAPGVFTDRESESIRVANILDDMFDQSFVQLMADGTRRPAATATAAHVVNVLKRSPDVLGVVSTWTALPAAVQALPSTDGPRRAL
jgi:hypothetical protein